MRLLACLIPVAVLGVAAACSDSPSATEDGPVEAGAVSDEPDAQGGPSPHDDGGAPDRAQPKPPLPDTPAQIAIGDAHGCFMNDVHGVTCWGSSMHGESGAQTYTLFAEATPSAVENFPPGSVRTIAAGGGSSCAVLTDSTVACWGRLIFDGRLPPSTPQALGNHYLTRFPLAVAGLTDVAEVIVHGEDRTPIACARTYAGAVRCWGENYYGSLGTGDTQPQAGTVLVVPSGATALAKGYGLGANVYALVGDAVQVWGQDSTSTVPRTAHVMPGLEKDVAGISSSCAIKKDGSVWCWGRGIIAPNQTEPVTIGGGLAAKVDGLPASVTRVATSGSASCALTADGSVWCWGKNDSGEVGIESAASFISAPTKVALPGFVSQIEAAGVPGFCAFVKPTAASTTGKPYCWGDNRHGRVGLPLSTPLAQGTDDIRRFVSSPNEVVGLTESVTPRSMTFSVLTACGVSSSGTGRCWAGNVLVERSRRRAPTTFGGANVVQIEQSEDAGGAVCAVDKAGLVTCENGLHDYGLANAALPAGAKKIALTDLFGCAIRSDTGGLACWGAATMGAGALATRLANLGPELSSGVKDLVRATASSLCAVTSAAELRCFGSSAPQTVQSNVAALAPNTLCVKTTAGGVMCPVRNTALAQWAPSPVPWAVHQAWLDYGRALDDY